jgi:hypothetical protein
MPYPCLSPCMFLSPAVSYTRSCSTYVRRAGIKEPFPANLPRARCEDATTLSRPNGFDSEPLASTQRARRTTSLSSAAVVSSAKNGLHGKRSEQDVFARLRRATLRERGASCSHLFAVLELPGTPRTTRRHSRNRNLQLRGLLAQSCLRICFIPGDEGIVAPVCVADTPGGQEPGSAAQLSKAVVHLHNSGINAPFDVAHCPDSSATASCGSQPRSNPPTTICARRRPSTRHSVLGEAEPLLAAATLRQ